MKGCKSFSVLPSVLSKSRDTPTTQESRALFCTGLGKFFFIHTLNIDGLLDPVFWAVDIFAVQDSMALIYIGLTYSDNSKKSTLLMPFRPKNRYS